MTMTRRDWWMGVGALVLALLLHAAFPRYDWRAVGADNLPWRVDRWTGTIQAPYGPSGYAAHTP